MSTTFVTLRYVAFALFILFNSVTCILAALNLGSLLPNTEKFPEIDAFLIFTGALGVVVVFPVIFMELFRKNAFISRVAVEITWVFIYWIFTLSGAAAMTAIAPLMDCSPRKANGSLVQVPPQQVTACGSTNALLAFTWLNTLTHLAYLLGLLISAVIHSNENGHVWQTGVRDFQWYTQRKPLENPRDTYGRLAEPREPSYLPPVYAQHSKFASVGGGGGAYQVEPFRIEQVPRQMAEKPKQPPVDHMRNFQFPARPNPAALRVDTGAGDPYRSVPPAVPSKAQYSLYPQYVQSSSGPVPQPPKPNGPTPPPGGPWPRSNPQEPIRKQSRPPGNAPTAYPYASSPVTTAPLSASASPTHRPLPSRPRPSGPRHGSLDRQRKPPPLDLTLATSRR